jgi:hypothetical protein
MPIYHDSSDQGGFEHFINATWSLCYIATITHLWANPFLIKIRAESIQPSYPVTSPVPFHETSTRAPAS